jgi:hypothetical protein
MREEVDKDLASSAMMDWVHSELGLVYHFGPDKLRGFDKKELVLDNHQEQQQELENMKIATAKAMEELVDEDTRKLIAELLEKRGENRPSLFQQESDPTSVNEPQIFFLGTSSMKPGVFRGASAIYVTAK